MQAPRAGIETPRRQVVGSVATAAELAALDPAAADCDVIEIRLDGLAAAGERLDPAAWGHLATMPLLFTARRGDEGGAGDLDAGDRACRLETALPSAAWIDVEAASLDELAPTVARAAAQGIRLIVSHHDFRSLPSDEILAGVVARARAAGASVAKIAARVEHPGELARLADFTLADHGIALATMGMGRFAAASRVLCAQCGSVLNYGYLGNTPTAPGQWSARLLREALSAAEAPTGPS